MYNGIHNAFEWYETGDLVNSDTGRKMKVDCKDKWVRKLTKAFAFKCLRGLGTNSLLELVQKITAGLTVKGELLKEDNAVPKVYLGSTRPRSKHCCSLKDWTDRKKVKNSIMRWLNKKSPKSIWVNDDVDRVTWGKFKRKHGFNSAHMDEFIKRATKLFLLRSLKVSDNPRRAQEPPSDAFLAEMERILEKEHVLNSNITPVLSKILADGTLSRFAKFPTRHLVPGTMMNLTDPSAWCIVNSEDLNFDAAIMDLRAIDRWLERDDLSIDWCYEFILSKMLTGAAMAGSHRIGW